MPFGIPVGNRQLCHTAAPLILFKNKNAVHRSSQTRAAGDEIKRISVAAFSRVSDEQYTA
jgi:hypothetical protein